MSNESNESSETNISISISTSTSASTSESNIAPATPSNSLSALSRSKSGIGKEEWVGQQVKTFTRWVNDHLKKCPVTPIEDLAAGFDDGVRLVMLLCTLYGKGKPGTFTAAPKNIYAKRANIDAAFELMKDVGIRLPVTQVSHIIEHNLKMILGMVWVIILHYNNMRIHELQSFQEPDLLLLSASSSGPASPVKATPAALTTHSSSSTSNSGGSAELKRILLKWANRSLNKRDMNVTRFTDEWRDGMAFLTILHDHDPELVPDYDTRTAENREDNLEAAFSAAEKLGVSRLLYVEDMVAPEKLDENSVVTYVAELHTAILEDKNRRAEESAKSAQEEADKAAKDAQSQMSEIQRLLEEERQKNEKLAEELSASKSAQEEADKAAREAQSQTTVTQQKLEEETSRNEKLAEEVSAAKSAQEEADKAAKEAQSQVTEIQRQLEEERQKNEKLIEELKAAKEAQSQTTTTTTTLEEVKEEEVKEEVKEEKKEEEEVKEEVKEEEVKEEEVKEEEAKEEVKKEEEVKEEEKKEEEVKKEEEKKEEDEKKKEEDEFDFMHSLAIFLAVITSGLLPLWLALPTYALLADRIIQDKFPYLKDKIPAATRKLMAFGIVAFNIAVAVLSPAAGTPAVGDATADAAAVATPAPDASA